MLLVISPAKTLDFASPTPALPVTQPRFLKQSQQLIKTLRGLDPEQIGALMAISPKLAELNWARYREWTLPFSPANAKPALFAFRGDVYTGLDADRFSHDDCLHAQTHLRILSGLYGVLRPLDLIQPYRLEMGTALANAHGTNLYQFWGDTITDALNVELAAQPQPVLINLASEEYFKAVRPKRLAGDIVTPLFKERKGGDYKIVSFYAKKARGLMSAFILRNRIEAVDDIRRFDLDGYRFNETLSRAPEWVFTRDERPAA